jgi:hypothetical protein
VVGKLANIRHEQFITELFRAEFNASEAYRKVYPAVRQDVARVCASKLLASANVKRRLEERQQAMIKRADVTVDRILNEYEEARDLAKSQAKPEAMMAASEKKAKLVGLLVERRESGQPGDFDGLQDPAEIIARVANEAGHDAAKALAKAFGIISDDEGTTSPHVLDAVQDSMRLDELDPEGSA